MSQVTMQAVCIITSGQNISLFQKPTLTPQGGSGDRHLNAFADWLKHHAHVKSLRSREDLDLRMGKRKHP